MDVALLIDAVVRQTTILIAQLATSGGNRAHLAHTANQVFLDLVAALREQGIGSKVIADMFGMALRTYQQRVQRLGESRTERGRTLWEAVFDYLQQHGPVLRNEVLRRFARDDEMVLRSLLKDLVGSGLVYRTGRGDHVRYHTADAEVSAESSDQSIADLVCLAVHRAAPATIGDVAGALSMEVDRVRPWLDQLLNEGRLRRVAAGTQLEERYTSNGCVIPLGETQGWEVAVFDHYQAMVTAICSKLQLGQQRATLGDLVGGSTFSYTVWRDHPQYEEATQFLARFRAEGAQLREKIALYNQAHEAASDTQGPDPEKVKIVIYAGQTLLKIDGEPARTETSLNDDDEEDDTDANT